MQVTFLLGPAGSGKTFRCLAEIGAALKASPEGPPLLLLAPKQATFQLERQLLADPDLPGYTRLQILSFERLAEFVLAELAQSPPCLDDEGRVMVLRSLLMQLEREKRLRLFHAAARLPGFAQQLSVLLREFQRHQLAPAQLQRLSEKPGLSPALAAKLHDLALLLGTYLDWLRDHQLQDANQLLDLAAEALRAVRLQPSSSGSDNLGSPLRFAGLWMDGFAEMTPQEIALLAEVTRGSAQTTLAFCLDGEPEENTCWLSTWSVVAQTFRQCHQRIAELPDAKVTIETLPRRPETSRFASNPVFQHLEAHWTAPMPWSEPDCSRISSALRTVICSHPEAEAVLAAHEILRHVRAGGRFRDCAVLVRTLDGYHDALRRVFTRYQIPFFLDRREPVAHHPLAELTRYALRTVAFGWLQEDWLGVLKTGLLPAAEAEIDWLENAALEHGWQGTFWREPVALPANERLARETERLRQKLVPPFLALAERLAETNHQPTGAQLAEALRELWDALDVETRLEAWANPAEESISQNEIRVARSPIHSTVWDQMQSWLDNLARAFAHEALPLRDWLPILEAGLSGLTVGVVPPALDQVLIGAIDRSRNPDLQLALVLGVNEGVFPAPPPTGVLLTDADRDELENHRVFLGPNRKLRLGHERFFGYIACTRARRRLVLTCAAGDDDGQALNPSFFFHQLRRLFPKVEEERCGGDLVSLGSTGDSPVASGNLPNGMTLTASHEAPSGLPGWLAAEHACELAPALLQNASLPSTAQSRSLRAFETLPLFASLVAKWKQVSVTAGQKLSPGLPEKLFGTEMPTSVSALENYAECPFKFFVARGLHAEERKQFEIDERVQGTFLHEVMKEFHWQVRGQGRLWRYVPDVEAAVMIRRIGEDLLPSFQNGLFLASAAGRFQAEGLIEQLERLVMVLMGWMNQYEFDPYAAELDFGLPEAHLPAWRLPLDDKHALLLRGRIDRVDIWRSDEEDEALAAVIDYKSSVHPLDATKLRHGLQLQLLSYLSVLRHLENPQDVFHVSRLVPAGVFYVGLRGEGGSAPTRGEALASGEEMRKSGYRHTGRFNAEALRLFDNRADATTGDQFKYQLKKDGTFAARGNEALSPDEFAELLEAVEDHLRRIGREVFAGEAQVAPYRKKNEIACQRCDFRAVCRFDPWVEPYRVLRPPPKNQSDRRSAPTEHPIDPTPKSSTPLP